MIPQADGLPRRHAATVHVFAAVLALAALAWAADEPLGRSVRDYGALGDGSGRAATRPWLEERGYPPAKQPPDHTVIGIAFGKRSDDPRIGRPKDGDRWYSCEWSPDKAWHYVFGIMQYGEKDKTWQREKIAPGETIYVENENAYYVATEKRRLRKAYVPDVDTQDYVGIQEAAYANPLGRIYLPRGHYKLNRGIKLHKLNLCIEGENCHGTVVENTGTKGEDLFYISNYGVRDDRSRRPTFVSDLTLVGNDRSGRGVAMFSAGFYTVQRVRFRAHGSYGLYFNSCLAPNVIQTYFRDCGLRTEGWANCFTLDTAEMRGKNTYLWAEGIEVGTIKNLCIEAVTGNEHVHRFDKCSNVEVRDLYTETLGVKDPSVPIVEIGPRCQQMEFYNCRFTMHRETPKSECLVDAEPGSKGIFFNRCRVNRVDRPYPKIRNRSHRGVLHFHEFNFAKIGTYEGAVKFTSPQLSWAGTRPVIERDPRLETLYRANSTVVTDNLVAFDSDFDRDVHFKAVKGEPSIALAKDAGYGAGGCVRIEGKAGDVVEFSPDHLRPFKDAYVFPFWMMRSESADGVLLTAHWNLGKYYVPMPVRAQPEWRLHMIVNGQDRFDGIKDRPVFRLAFDEDGTICIDRIHVVQSPFYTPALWDEYNYIPSK